MKSPNLGQGAEKWAYPYTTCGRSCHSLSVTGNLVMCINSFKTPQSL